VRVETYDAEGIPVGVGTSFIIAHHLEGRGEELFLVSNKHVIEGGKIGYIYFTSIKNEQPDVGNPFFIKIDDFDHQWHGHPLDEIDVAVMPLSWQLDSIGKDGMKAYYMKITTDIVASLNDFENIEPIKSVIFIGYPNGIFDNTNYTPIVRQGITATPVQFDFDGWPVFLIDASVFPGSSGSPVFSYEVNMGGGVGSVMLLGILAEVMTQTDTGEFELVPAPTQLIPVVKYNHMIDLGVVFKSNLIIEAIDSFWASKKPNI
jgi:hypothetical protein